MQDARQILLDRLDLVGRELAVLRQLVVGLAAEAPALAAPVVVATPVAPAPAPAAPARTGTPSIDPAAAAELLGVARQTIDRRLKDGKADAPGGPVDVSEGNVRSRWRWYTEDDVRLWWSHVG